MESSPSVSSQPEPSSISWKSHIRWWPSGGLDSHEEKVLLILTLIIGAVVGLVVAGFIYVTENLGARMYPTGGAPWRRLVIPVAGALFSGYWLSRYFPNARGSGIPQTKAALFLREGFITFRTAFGKFFCCSISLASGIALGREGPSVHIGAGLSSVLGRRLGLSPKRIRDLIPVGASAALAAAFNTPVAAVLFTLEEVMGDLHAPVLGSIVMSSATAWIVLHLLLGDEPLFHVPSYQLVSPIEFVTYGVLGVAGGLMSVCFVKLLLWIRGRFVAFPKWTEWAQPAAGGLVVGLMGWFFPDVLGVGYQHVSEALNGQIALHVMAILVLLKVVATAACYGSGNAGGIFGPSLFMGAMLGGAVGTAAHQLLPDYTGSVGAYALVGMGAAFAGIVRVPLTSVIMIFEMTRDYTIIVPLMISNLISFYISYRLQKEPIYEALQHQDGLHLPGGARSRQETLTVGDAASSPAHVLTADHRFEDAVALLNTERNAWPVTDGQRLLGMIPLAEVQSEIAAGHGNTAIGRLAASEIPREEISSKNFPHVHMDQSVDVALKRMADSHVNVLPVVSRADLRDLKGIVTLNGILQAYGVSGERARLAPASTQEGGASRYLLASVIAVALALAVLIGFLNYYYRSARGVRADTAYKNGVTLALEDRDAEAVEQFRNALSISPGAARYRLALGLELVKMNRLDEGAVYLREVLQADPGNGPANLGLARIAAAEARINDAITFYHRAIDASWPPGDQQNRVAARFEVAAFLAKQNMKTQAIAELLGTLEQARDTGTKTKVGQLLLEYGSPRQSAELFREISQSSPRDEGAWTGLGNADLALDNYAQAATAFSTATRLDPGDQTAKKQLDMAQRVLSLDPDARGIRASERYDRSQALLMGALQIVDQCASGKADPQLGDNAKKALAQRIQPRRLGDATEENISLAIDLWKERTQLCPSHVPSDQALERLLAKLSRN